MKIVNEFVLEVLVVEVCVVGINFIREVVMC